MSQATTTYEKLLEAQNEQLRETVEKLSIENDRCYSDTCMLQTQYNQLHTDIIDLLTRAKKHIKTELVSRQRKEYHQVEWTCVWDTKSDYWREKSPALYPIMRQIWLDHMQSQVEGMKVAFRNDVNGSYSYMPAGGCKFATEVKKPIGVTPT